MDFLFVGNHPALDFLNTRPVMEGEPCELLPDFAALVRWFHAAGLLDEARAVRAAAQTGAAQRVLADAIELRERLRREVVRWEGGHPVSRETVGELNRLMAAYPLPGHLHRTAAGLELAPRLAPEHAEELLGALAWQAAELFAKADPDRVRQCDNCVLHFLDTSKKGTRRWCSMQLCGNRNKVAAYAERQRKQND